MDRLKTILITFLLLTALGSKYASEGRAEGFTVDWANRVLEVEGTGYIVRGERGNFIQWQHEAAERAKTDLIRNYIISMNLMRLDAYNFASDLMRLDPEINEPVYNYISNQKKFDVMYDDDSVVFTAVLPLFSQNGLASFMIDAGTDTGNFPSYEGYVYSTNFTGLVIDARGLGREPAFAPRIFDEDYRVVYSISLMEEESFKKRGAVQYTDDPYYTGYEERVGDNPARFVALSDDKLIETDISLSNEDAKVLLQNDITRENLKEGRVIIIIDKVKLKSVDLLTIK